MSIQDLLIHNLHSEKYGRYVKVWDNGQEIVEEDNLEVEKVIHIGEGMETAEPGEPEEDSEVAEVMEETSNPPLNSFLANSPTRTSPT